METLGTGGLEEPRIDIEKMERMSSASVIVTVWVNNWLDIAMVSPKRYGPWKK